MQEQLSKPLSLKVCSETSKSKLNKNAAKIEIAVIASCLTLGLRGMKGWGQGEEFWFQSILAVLDAAYIYISGK